jgi:hypothetical protein
MVGHQRREHDERERQQEDGGRSDEQGVVADLHEDPAAAHVGHRNPPAA